jgi:hypothetical protein
MRRMGSRRSAAAAAGIGVALALGPAAPAGAAPTAGQRQDSCDVLRATPQMAWRNPESGRSVPATPAEVARLPERVLLRVPRGPAPQAFNRGHDYALLDGDLFARSRRRGSTPAGAWRRVVVPACFAGRIRELDTDRDWLVVVAADRRVFATSHADRGPSALDWTMRWGPILGFGEGVLLPRDTAAWSLSSTAGTYRFRDASGGLRRTAGAGTLYEVREGGRRITYDDPWLPTDGSYELCAPEQGRARVAGIAAAGATVMAIGPHGELWTRSYDFDLSGANTLLLQYGYGSRTPWTAIRLPLPGWRRQPAIGRPVTDAITVAITGTDEPQRLLRVEGRDARGRVGVWQKALDGERWRWVRTGGRLHGRPLPQAAADAPLGAPDVRSYRGAAGAVRLEVPDMSVACSPATLRVRAPSGQAIDLRLHLAEAIRQATRGPGLDATPRGYVGEIEVPVAVSDRRGALDPALRAFLDGPLGGRRWNAAPVLATSGVLRFTRQCWALTPDGRPAPPLDLAGLVHELTDLGMPVNVLFATEQHAAPTPLRTC